MALSTTLKKMLIGRAFTTERGRIKLFGKMDWIMQPCSSFAILIQRIGEQAGPYFLYKVGYDGGKKAGEEMVKYMGLKAKAGWVTQQAIIEMLEFIGYGRPEFIVSKMKKDGHHHFIVHVKDNPTLEHANALFGSKSLVCNWFMGIYAAHAEMELGLKNVKLKENKCICKGAPYCEWESKW